MNNNNLGILDFINLIYDGHHEYTLIAVKDNFENTIQGFINISQSLKTRPRFDSKSVQIKENIIKKVDISRYQNLDFITAKNGDLVPPIVTFLELENSQWTIILRSIFYANDEIFDTPIETKALSTELQTQAILLVEEDTSGAIAYELWDNGDRLEYFEEYCDDDFTFESQLREKPKINFNIEEDFEAEIEDNIEEDFDGNSDPRVIFVNNFFQELGIYLPACYPTDKNGNIFLVICESSQGKIKRADGLKIEFDF